MSKEIFIFIDEDGETITTEMRGFVGKECESEVKDLHDDLGGKVISTRKTAEYFKQGVKQNVKH